MHVGAISAALSALISPLVLVNQSQAPTVAYLTQRELLKTINQQDSQRVNTYGFWQNDPKLDLYYGQNANVADRALTDVNYHRFNYRAGAIDATVELNGINSPMANMLGQLGYVLGSANTQVSSWNYNQNSPIYNPNLKNSRRAASRIIAIAKSTWANFRNLHPDWLPVSQPNNNQEYVSTYLDQVINNLGSGTFSDNHSQAQRLLAMAGGIGSMYPNEMNVVGQEGWLGEWLDYPTRATDNNYQSRNDLPKLESALTMWIDEGGVGGKGSIDFNVFKDKNRLVKSLYQAVEIRKDFMSPFLLAVGRESASLSAGTELGKRVLFNYLRSTSLGISGFNPLAKSQRLSQMISGAELPLDEDEKQMLSAILEKKLNQIMQLVDMNWAAWVEQQGALLKDPELIQALKDRDPTQAEKIVDLFIAKFRQTINRKVASFTNTTLRVKNQNIDQKQVAINYVFDNLMLNEQSPLLADYVHVLVDNKNIETFKILFKPLISLSQSEILKLFKQDFGIAYQTNMPRLLQNWWFLILASNWKVFANQKQIELISDWGGLAFNVDQPEPNWKQYESQYLKIGQLLFSQFPLPNNLDSWLAQGAISYQSATTRLQLIQQAVQNEYSATGKIDSDLQNLFNLEAINLIKINNKYSIVGALINSIDLLVNQNLSSISQQEMFNQYLTLNYGSGQDVIEALSKAQALVDLRLDDVRNWVLNSVLGKNSSVVNLGNIVNFNNWFDPKQPFSWLDLKRFAGDGTTSVFSYSYEQQKFSNPTWKGIQPSQVFQIEAATSAIIESGRRVFLGAITVDLYTMVKNQDLDLLNQFFNKLYPNDQNLIDFKKQPVLASSFFEQILVALNNWNDLWQKQFKVATTSYQTGDFLSAQQIVNNIEIITNWTLNDQMVLTDVINEYFQRAAMGPDRVEKLLKQFNGGQSNFQSIKTLWKLPADEISNLHRQYYYQPVSEQTMINSLNKMVMQSLNNLASKQLNSLTTSDQIKTISQQIVSRFSQNKTSISGFTSAIMSLIENVFNGLTIKANDWIEGLFYQMQGQWLQFENQFGNLKQDQISNLQKWSAADMFSLADLIMVSPMIVHSAYLTTQNAQKPGREVNILGESDGLSVSEYENLGFSSLYKFFETSTRATSQFNLLNARLENNNPSTYLINYNQTYDKDNRSLIVDYSNGGFWDQLIFTNSEQQNQLYQSILDKSDLRAQQKWLNQAHVVNQSGFVQAQSQQIQSWMININYQNTFSSGRFLTTFAPFKVFNPKTTNYVNPFDLFKSFQNEIKTTANQQANNFLNLNQVPFNNNYQIVNLNDFSSNWALRAPAFSYLQIFNQALINKTFSSSDKTLNNLKNIIKSANDVRGINSVFNNNYELLNKHLNNFDAWKLVTQVQTMQLNAMVDLVSSAVGMPNFVGEFAKALGTVSSQLVTIAFKVVENVAIEFLWPIVGITSFFATPDLNLSYWQQIPPNFGGIANNNAYLDPDLLSQIINRSDSLYDYRFNDSPKAMLDLAQQLLNDQQFSWDELLGNNISLQNQLKPLIKRNLETIVEHQQDALVFDRRLTNAYDARTMRSDGISSTKFIDLNQKFESFIVNNSNIFIESFNSLNYSNEFYQQFGELVNPVFTTGLINKQKAYGAAGQFLKFNTRDLLQGMTSAVLSVRNRDAANSLPIDYQNQLELNKIYTLNYQATPEIALGGKFDARSLAIKNFEENNRWYNFIPLVGYFWARNRRDNPERRLRQFIMTGAELPVIKALPYLPTNVVNKIINDANGGVATDWQHNLLAYSTLTLQIVQLPNGNAALKVVQDIFDNGSNGYVYLEDIGDPNGTNYDQGEHLDLFGLSYVSRVLSQPSAQVGATILQKWLAPDGIISQVLKKADVLQIDPNDDLGFNNIFGTKAFRALNDGNFNNIAVNSLVKQWNQLIKEAANSLKPADVDYLAPWFTIDIDNRFDLIKSVLSTTKIIGVDITWSNRNSTSIKGDLSFKFTFEIGGNVLNYDQANIMSTQVREVGLEHLPIEYSFSEKINQLLKIVNVQNLTLNTVGFNKEQIVRNFYKNNLPKQKLLEQDYQRALRWAFDQEALYDYINLWTTWIKRASTLNRQFSGDDQSGLNQYAKAQTNLLTIATEFSKVSEANFIVDYEQLDLANQAFKNNLQQIMVDENMAIEFLAQLNQLNVKYSANQANYEVESAFNKSYLKNPTLLSTEDKLKFLADAINAGWSNGTTIDKKYQQEVDQDQIEIEIAVADVFSVSVNVNDSIFANRFSPIEIEDLSRGQTYHGKPQADGNYLWEFNTSDTTNQLTFTNFTNVEGSLVANEYKLKVDASDISELKTKFVINFKQKPASYDNITIANSPSSDFLVNGPYSKDWFLVSQQFELTPYNQWSADTFKKLNEQGQLDLIFSDDPDQLVMNYFEAQGWDQNHLEVIAYEGAKALDDPSRFNKYLMKNPFKIFKSEHEKQTGTIHDIMSVKTPNLANSDTIRYKINDTHYSSNVNYQMINQWAPELMIDITWLQQSVVDLKNQFQVGDQIVWGEVDENLKFNEPIVGQNTNQQLVNINFGLLKPSTIKTISVNEQTNLQFQFAPQRLYKLSISRKVNNANVIFNKYVYYTTESIINIGQHQSLNKIAYLDQYFNQGAQSQTKLQFSQFFDDGNWQMLLHNQALINGNNQAQLDNLEKQKYDLSLSNLLAIIKNQQSLLSQSNANTIDIEVIKRKIVNKIQAVVAFVQSDAGFNSGVFDILANNSFLNYIELFNDNQIKQLDADLTRILQEIQKIQTEINQIEANKAENLALKNNIGLVQSVFNQIKSIASGNVINVEDSPYQLPNNVYDSDDYQNNALPKSPKSYNLWFKKVVVEDVFGLQVGTNNRLEVVSEQSKWNSFAKLIKIVLKKDITIEATIKNIYLEFLNIVWFKNLKFGNNVTILFKTDQAEDGFVKMWSDPNRTFNDIFNEIEIKAKSWFDNKGNEASSVNDWQIINDYQALADPTVNGNSFAIKRQNNLNKFSHYNNSSKILGTIVGATNAPARNFIGSANMQTISANGKFDDPIKIDWKQLALLLEDFNKGAFKGLKLNGNDQYLIEEQYWHYAIPVLVRGDIDNNGPRHAFKIGWKLSNERVVDDNKVDWTKERPGIWIRIRAGKNNRRDLVFNSSTFSDPDQVVYEWKNTIKSAINDNQLKTLLTDWFGSDLAQRDTFNNRAVMPLLSDFREANGNGAFNDWGGQSLIDVIFNDNVLIKKLKDIFTDLTISNKIPTEDKKDEKTIKTFGFELIKTIVNEVLLYSSANKEGFFESKYNISNLAKASFDATKIDQIINNNISNNQVGQISISFDQANRVVDQQFSQINQQLEQANQELKIYQSQLEEQQQLQQDIIKEKGQILSQGSSMYLMLASLFVTNKNVYQQWSDLLNVDLPFVDKLEVILKVIKRENEVKMQTVVEQLIGIENEIARLQALKQQTFYQSSLDAGVAREAALYLLKNVRDISFTKLMGQILKINNWQGNLGINLTNNLISDNALWTFSQIKDFDDLVEPLVGHPSGLKTKSIQLLGSVWETNLNKRSYFIISLPLIFASDTPQIAIEKFRIFFADDSYINLNGASQWIEKVMNQPLIDSLINENQERLFRYTGAKLYVLKDGYKFVHFGYNPFDPTSKPTQANTTSLLFKQAPALTDYFFKEKAYLATIKPSQAMALNQKRQVQKILNTLGYFQLSQINEFTNFDQIFDQSEQNQMQIFAKRDHNFKVALIPNVQDAFSQNQFGLLNQFNGQTFNVLKTDDGHNASGARKNWLYYDRIVLVDQFNPDLTTDAGKKAAIVLTKSERISIGQWINFVDNLLNRSFFASDDLIANSVLPTEAKTILDKLLTKQTSAISIPMQSLKTLAKVFKFDLTTSANDEYLSQSANLFSDSNRVIIELAHQNVNQDLITNSKFTLINIVIKISAKTNEPFIFSPKLILLKNAILEKTITNQNLEVDFSKTNSRDLFSQLKTVLINQIQDNFISTVLKTTTNSLNNQLSDLNYILETLFNQATFVNRNYSQYFDPFLDQNSQKIVPTLERVPLILSEIVSASANSDLFANLIELLQGEQPLVSIKDLLVNKKIISFEMTNPDPSGFIINPSYKLFSQLTYRNADFKTISLELSFNDVSDPIKAAAKAQGLLNTPLDFDGQTKYVNFKLVDNQIIVELTKAPARFNLINLLSEADLRANEHYQNLKIINALDQVQSLWMGLIGTSSLKYEAIGDDKNNEYQVKIDPTNSGILTSAKLFYNLEKEDLTLGTSLMPVSADINLTKVNDVISTINEPKLITKYFDDHVVSDLVSNWTVEQLSNVQSHLLRIEPLLEPSASLNGNWILVVETLQDGTRMLSQFVVSGLRAITNENYALIGTNRSSKLMSLNQGVRDNFSNQALLGKQTLIKQDVSAVELNVAAIANSSIKSQFATNYQQIFSGTTLNQIIDYNQIPRVLKLTSAPAQPQWVSGMPSWAIAILLIGLGLITLGLGTWWWRERYHKSNRQR